jgi:hypothetical protein
MGIGKVLSFYPIFFDQGKNGNMIHMVDACHVIDYCKSYSERVQWCAQFISQFWCTG